jgi:hypothetical protein
MLITKLLASAAVFAEVRSNRGYQPMIAADAA